MSAKEYFDVGVASIFAREVLEGSIIIINYRAVIRRSQIWEGEREKEALRIVTKYAIIAGLIAVVCILAIAVPLQVISNNFDDRYAKLIEGASKIVAAICILQISLKIPTWLGVYEKKNGSPELGITLREIKFNVLWNLWREVAECGIFLIPFFLIDGRAISIPLSALAGILISLTIALGTHIGSKKLKNKFWLVLFLSTITASLALGLFVSGCHLFETVLGSTPVVWKIEKPFWDSSRFPMTMLKPFGYSSSRTVLQICTFWIWLAITIGFHYRKYRTTSRRKNGTDCESLESAQDETSSSHSQNEENGEKNSESIEFEIISP